MSADFVHLKVHSDYSIQDSIVKVTDLPAAVRAQGGTAIALSDRHNLGGVIAFYHACIHHGIKPIIGCEFLLEAATTAQPTPFTLLACNSSGYHNLVRLCSYVYQHPKPQHRGQYLRREDFVRADREGLIALSGGQDGEIGRALLRKESDQAQALVHQWQQYFPGSFYLEVQHLGRAKENRYLKSVVSLARDLHCPLVATNDVRFLQHEDHLVHEVRVGIGSGEKLAERQQKTVYTPQQYLRSASEMADCFADLPSALSNSVYIAQRCNHHLQQSTPLLPRFVSAGNTDNRELLRTLARRGLQQHLRRIFHRDGKLLFSVKMYLRRLYHELEIINHLNFADYFLIVRDFVAWALDHSVPVGPGRGSGAGSLVAWSLGITKLDPLQYGLFFERFLNPARKGMPDFDIDFCIEGRDRVIEYAFTKYGAQSVAQIIAYGTLGARAVVRDVTRVLGRPYALGSRIIAWVSGHPGATLAKCLREEAAEPGDARNFFSAELATLYQRDAEVREVVNMALKLEGLVRNVSTHAAGVVIAPGDFIDYCPIYADADYRIMVTQFNKNDVEKTGLVKFDFLGLKTLTIIDRAVQGINLQRDHPLSMEDLPLDDNLTYDLLCSAQTRHVFQLESSGMRRALKQVQPRNIEEITALIALFRPGPMQFIDHFAAVKFGREQEQYAHPSLKSILEPTYGVAVYQEQVMQIAQALAGYDLSQADDLRRRMSKKLRIEGDRDTFVASAIARGADTSVADQVFDVIAKFAGYGFNKAHAAAYALLSYQTAWLKAHEPLHFMRAVLNTDIHLPEAVADALAECQACKIVILPPCVNHSDEHFTIERQRALRFGLAAIKGFGEKAAQALVAARGDQPFTDVFDLCLRVPTQHLHKRNLLPLIEAGACDILGLNRATLETNLEMVLDYAQQQQENRKTGSVDLFGEQQGSAKPHLKTCSPWPLRTLLQREKAALGIYTSGNLFASYAKELRRYGIIPLKKVMDDRTLRDGEQIAGIVQDLRIFSSRDGKPMARFTLLDDDGALQLRAYDEVLAKIGDALQNDALICCNAGYFPQNKKTTIEQSDTVSFFIAKELISLETLRTRHNHLLRLRIPLECLDDNLYTKLQNILRGWMTLDPQAGLPVQIFVLDDQQNSLQKLEMRQRIRPSVELRDALTMLGVEVRLAS